MSSRNPQLGSIALQSPSSETQTVRITPATCNDLSLFKSILKEYRKLDDGITMRLNRAQAFIRDQERERTSPGPDSIQNQACIAVWRELMGNWKRRTQLINYCVSVVDESIAENKDLAERSDNPAEQRRAQATSYAEEVKV
ncbi:hypothetical protein CC2G_010557 [Coprinopsis cinerea AmutBmut pab1-1]|nr:hypothetical protein CC2G_010557 [Coprinopsis cinerea AmutBmut pab1-1]